MKNAQTPIKNHAEKNVFGGGLNQLQKETTFSMKKDLHIGTPEFAIELIKKEYNINPLSISPIIYSDNFVKTFTALFTNDDTDFTKKILRDSNGKVLYVFYGNVTYHITKVGSNTGVTTYYNNGKVYTFADENTTSYPLIVENQLLDRINVIGLGKVFVNITYIGYLIKLS